MLHIFAKQSIGLSIMNLKAKIASLAVYGIFYTWWSPWLFWRSFKALSALDLSSRALMAYNTIIIKAWEIITRDNNHKVVPKTIWTQLKTSECHGFRKISNQVAFILKKHSTSSLKQNISNYKIILFRVQILSGATVCIKFTNILRTFWVFTIIIFIIIIIIISLPEIPKFWV